MPRVNMQGVKTGFEALPVDNYPSVFTGFKNKVNKNRDNMVVAEFTVSDGDYEGRKVFNNFNLDETGTKFLKLFLQTMGATEEVLEGEFDTDDVLPQFIGSAVIIATGDPRPWNGQEMTTVKRILPPV